MSETVVTRTIQTDFIIRTDRDRGPRRSLPSKVVKWLSDQDRSVTGTASKVTFVDFIALKQRVKDTLHLPHGWDSGEAGPMSPTAVHHAILLLDALESTKIWPSRVVPTCDDSILIRYSMYDQTIEWEFFSQGDNVRVQIDSAGEKSYLEVSVDEISTHI